MKSIAILFATLLSLSTVAEVKLGDLAPDFTETDAAGKPYSLKDFKGKWLVLEWYNKDCPYVKKHYGSGNMQALQKAYTGQNVAWLSVISSAKGKQGYLQPDQALKNAKESGSNATAVLIDSDGNMGKAYGAKTTPHMFVIDPQGKVMFEGAIDDNDSANPSVIPKSKNYVKVTLDKGLKGEGLVPESKKPYGCSVKYN